MNLQKYAIEKSRKKSRRFLQKEKKNNELAILTILLFLPIKILSSTDKTANLAINDTQPVRKTKNKKKNKNIISINATIRVANDHEQSIKSSDFLPALLQMTRVTRFCKTARAVAATRQIRRTTVTLRTKGSVDRSDRIAAGRR